MPKRLLGETLDIYAIRSIYETGHLWGVKQTDLPLLKISDPEVIAGLRSYSMSNVKVYARAALEAHGRPPEFDGEVGPAMTALLDTPRCPVPDIPPPPGVHFAFADPYVQEVVDRMQMNSVLPAQGSGGWVNCHGVVNGHCAIGRWNLSNKPAHLTERLFKQVLIKVQASYAQMGLLWRFVDESMKDLLTGEDLSGMSVNTDCSFVTSSDGWIGLAILGRNETCSSRIWARFLATYKGGNTDESIVNQWWSLIVHELMHNCGRNHTNGGVMNPSLIVGLAMTLIGDTSEQWCRGMYSGVPIAIPDGDIPGPTPTPPGDGDPTLSEQFEKIRINDIIQTEIIYYTMKQVKELRAQVKLLMEKVAA